MHDLMQIKNLGTCFMYLKHLLICLLKYREHSHFCKYVHFIYPVLGTRAFFYFSFIVLRFYWQSYFTSKSSAGEATQLGFFPYIPQCDGLGNWEPVQCYESTGEQFLTRHSALSKQKNQQPPKKKTPLRIPNKR